MFENSLKIIQNDLQFKIELININVFKTVNT